MLKLATVYLCTQGLRSHRASQSSSRPFQSGKQRDTLSSAFILKTVGAHSILSIPIFLEAETARKIRDRVDERIGRKRVVFFVDNNVNFILFTIYSKVGFQ